MDINNIYCNISEKGSLFLRRNSKVDFVLILIIQQLYTMTFKNEMGLEYDGNNYIF